jgi:hypothetical protein
VGLENARASRPSSPAQALLCAVEVLQGYHASLLDLDRAKRGGDELRRHFGLPGRVGRGETKHTRVAHRAVVALAAKVSFDLYARGFVEAMAGRRTSLYGDLRGACSLIWMWANVESRVLALAVHGALRGLGSPGATGRFPAFERLLALVLDKHLDPPQGAGPRATYLAGFLIDRLPDIEDGKSGHTYLLRPAMEALSAHENPAVRVDVRGRPESGTPDLAEAMLPVLRDVRNGAMAPEAARERLGVYADAVSVVGARGHDVRHNP